MRTIPVVVASNDYGVHKIEIMKNNCCAGIFLALRKLFGHSEKIYLFFSISRVLL